jgi:hypothetical protein
VANDGNMTYPGKPSWPADRIQRTLRANEALKELLRAQRVYLASREQLDIPVRPEAIRRLVELGLKAKGK